jgi:hypothetical protein
MVYLKEPCVDFDPLEPSIQPPTLFLIYIRISRELVSSHSTRRHTTLELRNTLLPRKTHLITEEEASFLMEPYLAGMQVTR